ncbi:MAG TPA: hypothetical protein ENH65_15170 [Candidatus Aminicenantes bacterium]|nr:hypothetical protein [Candidatus Aminicenantes bacterium]
MYGILMTNKKWETVIVSHAYTPQGASELLKRERKHFPNCRPVFLHTNLHYRINRKAEFLKRFTRP